eukprot:TRINITY_DN1388_c0_g2_i1.p1 TRINITY_DN1388_c0_g2~~TRINITY_DN1388_c0_g2_i1.p1  ORF type:complete len:453 (+),score=115.91 TRINITY_DN1388_c0_g2_i1:202-1560(+)
MSDALLQCRGCDGSIEGGDEFIDALGSVWHVAHFRCSWCLCVLSNGFFAHGGKPYCPHDFYAAFAETCIKCGGKVIDEIIHANRNAYHRRCFVCDVCGVLLPMDFNCREGRILCDAHANESIPHLPTREEAEKKEMEEALHQSASSVVLRENTRAKEFQLKGFHAAAEKELKDENEQLKTRIQELEKSITVIQNELSQEKKRAFLLEKQVKSGAEEIERIKKAAPLTQSTGAGELTQLRDRLKIYDQELKDANAQIDELTTKLTAVETKGKRDAQEIVSKAREITKKAELRTEEAEKRAAKAEEQLRLLIEKIKSSQNLSSVAREFSPSTDNATLQKTENTSSIPSPSPPTASTLSPPPPPPPLTGPIVSIRIPTSETTITSQSTQSTQRVQIPAATPERSGMLSAIQAFDRTRLSKTNTQTAHAPSRGADSVQLQMQAILARKMLPGNDDD